MTDEIFGFSIPFRIDPETGGVARASGSEKLKENVVHILLTGIGERVLRHEYGGGLRQLVHDPNEAARGAIVQHQIAKSIAQWEPRVLLENVAVTQKDGTLIAEISYTIRRTRQQRSVSVPIGLGGV